MSNKGNKKNSKIISLFVTFAILFVVVFALGVIIGKGLGGSDSSTSDRTYEIEAPEVEYGAPDMEPEESEVSEFESEVVILDEDEESVADDNTDIVSESTEAKESQKEESSEVIKPTNAPEEAKTPKKSEPEPKVVVEEKKETEVVVEKPKPEEKKSPKQAVPMPKIDPNGRYTVQIGAFQNQKEAEKLVSSLKSKGYPAFIKQVETPDKKTWYRVRVGTFATRPDAVVYGNKLKDQAAGVKSTFITINN